MQVSSDMTVAASRTINVNQAGYTLVDDADVDAAGALYVCGR
jgi:hypothetical protein